MSDAPALVSVLDRDRVPPRRRHWPTTVALLLLALVAGVAATALIGERWRRAASPAAVAAAPATAPAAVRPATPTLATVLNPATDPVMLAGRETLLAAQLGAIEARTASVGADADAASGQASRAEAMLIAFAARRAIDRGLRLGALEAPLRARFGAAQPGALALVVGASREPLTLEDLRGGLELLSTNLVTGAGGWWTALRRELASLIVIHRAGTPSPAPADRLARIRRLVETGQVEVALAEVGRMPGAADAGNWMTAARRYIGVHHALDTIEAAAIAGQAVPAPVPAPTVPDAEPTDPRPVDAQPPAAATP